MNLERRSNKDFWAGVMLLGAGLLAMGIARNYPFGTTLRMGPGYFPSVLGGILICFGLVIMAKGLRRPERIAGSWSLRALCVLPLSLIGFGLLIDRAGFVPALIVLIFGSAAAGNEFRWGEVLLLTVGLTLLSVAVFIWGLGLPYQLFTLF
jgi:uncharacterized membrane protein